MAMDLALVNRVRDAHTALITAIVSETPVRIQLPKAWVLHFESFADHGMSVPIGMHSEAVRLLGIDLDVECSDGEDDVAILTFANGSVKHIVLGAP